MAAIKQSRSWRGNVAAISRNDNQHGGVSVICGHGKQSMHQYGWRHGSIGSISNHVSCNVSNISINVK